MIMSMVQRTTVHFLFYLKCEINTPGSNDFFLLGDSCGGHMALAVSMRLSNQHVVDGLPPLKAMALFYPATQGVNFMTPSYRMCDDETGPFQLNSRRMTSFWALYGLGDDSHTDMFMANRHTTNQFKKSWYGQMANEKCLPARYQQGIDSSAVLSRDDESFAKRFQISLKNPEFSPLCGSDEELLNLPKIYLMTAEFDPLRDDGFLLAKRLADLGIRVDRRHHDGMAHGFLLFQWHSETQFSITETAEFFQQNL